MGVRRQRLPQAGQEIGGGSPAILPQAGEGGQLLGRDVLGLRQSLGPSLAGQAAVSAGELDLGRCPLPGGRCAGGETGYRSKTESALEMLALALGRDNLKAKWVAENDVFGMSSSFLEGLAALGMW